MKEETDKCISNLQTWTAFKIFFLLFYIKYDMQIPKHCTYNTKLLVKQLLI